MAKKTKKVTRKQLLKEPDEFLTISSRLLQFCLTYKYQLLAALGGIVVIVLAVSGIRYYAQQRANDALASLEMGRLKYQSLMAQGDARQAYLGVKEDFERILADYSGKMGAKLAQVYYAGICYHGGEPDKAIGLYQEALNDFEDSFYRNMIFNGLAYVYEEKKDLQKATEYFEKINAGTDPGYKSDALYNLGRLYAALGDNQKSKAAYQEMISANLESIYIDLAKERAGQ